jgi:hypothetical protein
MKLSIVMACTAFASILTGCGTGVSNTPGELGDPLGDDPPREPEAKDPTDDKLGGAGCDGATGTLHFLTSATDARDLTLGSWRQCGGTRIRGVNEAGFEFTQDGVFYLLRNDGRGGLVRATGFDSQGTWGTFANYADDKLIYTSLHATAWGNFFEVAFEDNPRRMQLNFVDTAPGPDPTPLPEAAVFVFVRP